MVPPPRVVKTVLNLSGDLEEAYFASTSLVLVNRGDLDFQRFQLGTVRPRYLSVLELDPLRVVAFEFDTR